VVGAPDATSLIHWADRAVMPAAWAFQGGTLMCGGRYAWEGSVLASKSSSCCRLSQFLIESAAGCQWSVVRLLSPGRRAAGLTERGSGIHCREQLLLQQLLRVVFHSLSLA
jgi:hypothetical protein